MIANDLAQPIVQTASKAYVKKYDPNKPTFQVIFHELWNPFLSLCKEKLITIPQYILYEVARMIACGTLDMGFEVYECPNCHRHHIICYTCKSRFCPSCGSKMTRARAYRISKSTLDVNHRHMVFTIDERIRSYFFRYPDWLNFLFDAAKEAIFYTFINEKSSRKKAKKKRNRKKTKDLIVPGFIITLHTYGRDAACDYKHKQAVKFRLLKQNRFKNYHDRPKHYRLSLIDTFGVDPLLCTCGSYMEFVDSYVPPRFRAGGEPP